ncbi:MAG: cytochrome c biogenesis protein CcdA [Chloroflexi bacterium]|nr:MAG: cytochrome c biogenesis protein CcdA [Chloroflexota bacterium]MBL1195533.1 cytochrome c biogenesis protein CcdA [Chloroflexota bacterium]NOH12815.1 cytochrome c biogenesis protein CcdA [Chloroflexota bacterium]
MDVSNLTLGLAFFAGLASFLSPCVFALVPAYVGYLSGRSVSLAKGGEAEESNSWVTLSHGLAFVVGFGIVFTLLGVLAGSLGGLLNTALPIIVQIGGAIIIVFGLHMTGIITIPFLQYDLRPQSQPDRNRGYFSSALMGVFFSAGWSPCVGPVLGAIFTLSLNGGSPIEGGALLMAYSAGLGIPFLIAATQIGWVTAIIRRYGRLMHYTEIVMGIILILLGILLASGRFESLIAPLTADVFFIIEDELFIGRLLLVGLVASILLGLAPAYLARQQGRPFVDWWFLGSGVSLVLIVVLFFLGVFDFVVPLIS